MPEFHVNKVWGMWTEKGKQVALTMRAERSRRNFSDEANRYDAKRERLVRCARRLAEQGDAAKVSVTDITSEMGITRGLFYYYFEGKEALNEAIIQTYIDDLAKALEASCGACENREDAMLSLVKCVQRWLYLDEGGHKPIWHVACELRLDKELVDQAADVLVAFIIDHSLLTKYGKFSDDLLYEHARFVATGLLGEIRLREGLPAEVLSDTACAALRYRKRRAPELEQLAAE